MLKLVPAYTLDTLNAADIDALLPYYFWDYRKAMGEKRSIASDEKNDSADVVEIGGKYYKRTAANKSKLLDSIF